MACKATRQWLKDGSSESVRVPIGSSSTLFVPYNRNRQSLIISNTTGGDLFISSKPLTSNADGLIIPTNNMPFQLSIATDGPIVFGPIYGLLPGGADTVTYWESVAPG